MSSVNKVILIGRLGQEPDYKQTANTSVCKLSVATSEKDKEGKEITEWHRVVCFGKTADNAAKYLAKGRQVYLEGKLQTRKYEKDGSIRYTTEIIAQQVQFLGSRSENEQDERKPVDVQAPEVPGLDEIPF